MIGMNEQKAPAGIEWTRIRNADGTIRRGYTWNPIAGCSHNCEWLIDGQRAECYAKTVAEKFVVAYPEGFEAYYWHEKRLNSPKKLRDGAGIFPDSMSDFMGRWVQRDHRHQVLDVMRETPQHIYQMLTKNAPAYLIERDYLPLNVWVGVSSPPDHMYKADLTRKQKEAYLHRALGVLEEMARAGFVTWMSFEPLSAYWAQLVAQYPTALKWAVIGAASNGRTYYPPNEAHVAHLIDVLDEHGAKVFFKGNLRSLKWAADNWRADFPEVAR